MTSDHYQSLAANCFINTYQRYPITLVKGEGAYVWDIHGKRYLDFLSGIGCTSLGHCHPTITQAITAQVQQIVHTSNLYYSPPNINLAKCLIDNGCLDKLFFCNSGAEANETALKLARKYQWLKGHGTKNVILSAKHSFHGRTFGALAATAKPVIQEGFSPLPLGFRYECWQDVTTFCAAINQDVAAVILEPIQGEGGIQLPPAGLLQAVRLACDKVGALLIFDEVQCGIGRTGELFAYQYFGVKPDILTLAKGIANGMPLGAVSAIEEVATAFAPGDHGSTFGGNPVSCSAALANLTVLINENYLLRIKQLSAYFLDRLKQLQATHVEQIKTIRGAGLMWGIELNGKAQEVLAYCQNNGLLLNVTAENVLRLLPPYVINEADLDFVIAVLSEALQLTA